MKELMLLLRELEGNEIAVSLRGLLYDQVNLNQNGCYVFTHSKSSDKFEAKISFLFKLYDSGRLFNPKAIKYDNTIKETNAVRLNDARPRHGRKSIQSKWVLEGEKAREMETLISEVRPLNFETSKQLSKYIVDNNLGSKYPTISGIARMKNASDEWDFKGGFPPEIYKMICMRLGLTNQGSSARLIGFSSYKSLS
ncbi:MAG: hypothetical protein JKY55_11455 [Aliivibrio sp.]|uniref:hypothetical protein n=1 Tax=Aliivibrio sp. TaxID=1872443 RepID=UPI001A59887C|nr:hypothetical protein [Aliivibrio sp.]